MTRFYGESSRFPVKPCHGRFSIPPKRATIPRVIPSQSRDRDDPDMPSDKLTTGSRSSNQGGVSPTVSQNPSPTNSKMLFRMGSLPMGSNQRGTLSKRGARTPGSGSETEAASGLGQQVSMSKQGSKVLCWSFLMSFRRTTQGVVQQEVFVSQSWSKKSCCPAYTQEHVVRTHAVVLWCGTPSPNTLVSSRAPASGRQRAARFRRRRRAQNVCQGVPVRTRWANVYLAGPARMVSRSEQQQAWYPSTLR